MMKMIRHEPYPFYKNWWLSLCDTIPTLPYNHDTRIWVGLDWNFIYLSISSLTAKVWAEATLWRLSTCAVPKMTVGHGWEAKLTGEVLILGRIIERLGLIIRILSMVIQDFSWRMYQILWWKCTTSAECQTIRIAASAVMDSWSGHTVPSSDVFKNDLWNEVKWSVNVTLTWPQQVLCDETKVSHLGFKTW